MIGIPSALPPPGEPEGERNEQLWIEFAKHALTGHCSIGNVPGMGEPTALNIVDWTVQCADLMVEEHAKRFRLKEPDFGALPKCEHVNKTKNFANHIICADCGAKIKKEP